VFDRRRCAYRGQTCERPFRCADGIRQRQTEHTLAQQEVFGPVLAVFRVGDFDEAMKGANNARSGLTCSIYTSDANLVMRLPTASRPACAHQFTDGGWRGAVAVRRLQGDGYGSREMSDEGLNFFTQLKPCLRLHGREAADEYL